jgi:hypothetical protein
MESVLDWVMRHELDEAGILLEQEQASRLAFGSRRFLRSKLVERDVRRGQLIDGVGHIVELRQRGDREPPTTNVADHRTTSTASRSACFWSRLRRSRQRRAGAGRLRKKKVRAA